ncbi:MAG: 2-dehydropantoate 2-reductase [Bryobacteraceae bacterium]|jgi:2-dehydropantoate 2-reductase
MRTLVVGAGAVGGYFGGRLLEADQDVTFLVRPRRAAELANDGLRIRSRLGDVTLTAPPTILAEDFARTAQAFDLVLLSLKAYDLEDAMASFAPAVGPDTAIVPLLNGMRHLETLDTRFGRARVLGGRCIIAATLNEKREIVHLNESHSLSFGERDGTMSARAGAIESLMAGARFEGHASATILQDMWEKWVFLATLAGGTCLMRAAVGDIAAAPGGADFVLHLLDECRTIAAAEGYAPREAFLDDARRTLTTQGSPFTASMLRDIENGGPIEADHIIGDLLRRGRDLALLPMVYTHLKAYEARRARSS